MEVDGACTTATAARKSPADVSTSSPQKKMIKSETTSSPATNKTNPLQSPMKLDREARALNIALEFSLQLTLRPEAAVDSIRYIGQDGNSGGLLNSTNISELICSRLTEGTENAVHYLTSCYKRIMTKESSVTPGILSELAK